MLDSILEILLEIRNKILSSRILILGIFGGLLFFVLAGRLFHLQIINGEDYQNNYVQKTERTISLSPTRGNIYDRNGVLLAYNTLNYDVIIRDTGYYDTYNSRNYMIYTLVRILEENDETIIGDLPIGLNAEEEYVFTTTSDAAKKRFLRDYYGLKNVEELDDAAGKYPSDITAEEIIEKRYKMNKLADLVDENNHPIVLSKREILDIINIRYTMSFKSYRRYEATTLAENVSEASRIQLLENSANLVGVEIEERSKRVYNDSMYFSSILGYTGTASEEQLKTLQDINPDYSDTDIVGRIGIEEYMESSLQGKKGSKTIYVDVLGRILDVASETQPVPGNDVYLTIDRDLQIAVYNLLERRLAGILSAKLVNNDEPNTAATDSTSRLIPIKDAYYQLIGNNVLDIKKMDSDSASSIEKGIASKYHTYHNAVIERLRSELYAENASVLSALDTDTKNYMYYIYNKLSADNIKIIDREKIDTNADYYQRWQADNISLRELLYYGISESFIDMKFLNSSTDYMTAGEIYEALVEYALNGLSEDEIFQKLEYKYLVKQGIITGRELCLSLYYQGILQYDENEINTLSANGENYAYTFMISKISDLEIKPSQLALDPCTAGAVVTDVNTGEVLALVSYPGYDNNRLSNTMDTEYYNALLSDQSLPLYNNATQARKAPGSTFKPITAVAALEEGKVSISELIDCTGEYDIITPAIRCWIYPGRHNELSIVGALRDSCNYYFAEVAHRLATNETGEYSANTGIEKIKEYATMFGLDHKSGVEIYENDPMISTENPEQSAMGQGNHAFSNIQLSRYVSALANKGNVYELSLIDKVADTKGTTVVDYSPTLSSVVDIKESTWESVQSGMREVIQNGSARRIFADLDVEIAGKTGTAQESKARANHAFFISFAPYTNPEVAVTVNIPFGYTSSNAAMVAKDIYKYYFGYTSLEDILGSNALDATNVKIGD